MAKTETADRAFTFPAWNVVKGMRRHALALGISAVLLWVVAAPIIMLILSSLREGNFIYARRLHPRQLSNRLSHAANLSGPNEHVDLRRGGQRHQSNVRDDFCLAGGAHRHARRELGVDHDVAPAGHAGDLAVDGVDSAAQPAQRNRQCLPARVSRSYGA